MSEMSLDLHGTSVTRYDICRGVQKDKVLDGRARAV